MLSLTNSGRGGRAVSRHKKVSKRPAGGHAYAHSLTNNALLGGAWNTAFTHVLTEL